MTTRQPTPETDALFMELPRGLGAALAKMMEHAQKLERERDALKAARPEALRIPRATLEKWHESLEGHRADSSDEAAWNNYGVIEVDDQIQKLLAESPLARSQEKS